MKKKLVSKDQEDKKRLLVYAWLFLMLIITILVMEIASFQETTQKKECAYYCREAGANSYTYDNETCRCWKNNTIYALNLDLEVEIK